MDAERDGSEMTYQITGLEIDETGIAVLTMRDAARKNALSFQMARELYERIDAIAHDERIRVVVISGLDEYFSTGADREVLEHFLSTKTALHDLLRPPALLDVPVPVISAMAGHAIGGGLALGICADITIIARESRYCASFINYGFTPGMGITRILEHAVGAAVANEMLLTGRAYRGSHFDGRGGFNYILPRKEVMSKALEIASIIAEKPRPTLAMLKCSLASRKRELFEAARAAECLMHQISFGLPEVESLIRELEMPDRSTRSAGRATPSPPSTLS
jgi:polyketide biosynthesis enoyl-CoA hydratase PksI